MSPEPKPVTLHELVKKAWNDCDGDQTKAAPLALKRLRANKRLFDEVANDLIDKAICGYIHQFVTASRTRIETQAKTSKTSAAEIIAAAKAKGENGGVRSMEMREGAAQTAFRISTNWLNFPMKSGKKKLHEVTGYEAEEQGMEWICEGHTSVQRGRFVVAVARMMKDKGKLVGDEISEAQAAAIHIRVEAATFADIPEAAPVPAAA